jgi:hypothetical protein
MRRRAIGLGLATLALGALGAGLAAAPRDAPAATAARIAYATTGGIAGIDDRLVVSAGGRAVLSTRRATTRRTLSHAAHGRLLRLVAAARIERLRAGYTPRTPVADGIDEVLTFHGRTVTVAQDAAAPRALRRALDALARLASDLARG